MLRRYLPILIQVLFWLGFLLLPFSIRYTMPSAPPLQQQEIQILLLFNILLVGFFYFNILFLIPRFLSQRKFMIYLGLIVATMSIMVLGFYLLTYNTPIPVPPGINRKDMPPVHLAWAMSSLLFFWFFSTGYKVTWQWLRAERRGREIENEKLKTELSYLQAQINPHFLFNTLNTIYTLARAKSDNTADAVLQLSQMMRYVLGDSKDDKVPLEKELAYIEHYIALQRLRLTGNVEVVFKQEGSPEGKRIAPLLLVPFVENAFKHGVSTHVQSAIVIQLVVKDNWLKFETQNRKLRKMNGAEQAPGTGLGIANVRRRLELLYRQKHRLEISDKDIFFTVHLELQLT